MKALKNIFATVGTLKFVATCTYPKNTFVYGNVDYTAAQTELIPENAREPTGKNCPRTMNDQNHFREDFSTYRVADIDTITGAAASKAAA